MGSAQRPAKRLRTQSSLPLAFGPVRTRATLNDEFSGFVVLADDVFLSDTYNNCIRRVTDCEVTTLAGSGRYGLVDGLGESAQFNWPRGICKGPAGSLLVADCGNKAIRRVTLEGSVTTVATLQELPTHVALGCNDLVYAAVASEVWDEMNCTNLVKVSLDGTVTHLAGNPLEQGWVDGVGDSARFYGVSSIAIGNGDSLFAVDSSDDYSCIRYVTASGSVSTLTVFSPDPSPPLSGLENICFQDDGTIFCSDNNNKIVKCTANIAKRTIQVVAVSLTGGANHHMFLDSTTSQIFFSRWEGDPYKKIELYAADLVPSNVTKWCASLRNPALADVTFLVNGERLNASRHTLSSHSEYFRAMFTQPLQESSVQEVVVQNTSSAAFEALLVYTYSGHMLPLPPEQMVNLAALADLHTLEDLGQKCSRILFGTLTPENVGEVVLSAHSRGLDQLVQGCKRYLIAQCAEVARAGGFKTIQAAPDLALSVVEALALRDEREQWR